LKARGPDFASAVVARIDTRTGTVEYATAGHPPPVIRGTDDRCRLLETGRGPLLGPYPNATYTPATDRLEPGETLVLYTDGLVERRRGLVGGHADRHVLGQSGFPD
ncbi:MAG TPA: PP2C family protein-serine/threonine phosphatase, partial [Lacipirellulaceae bacterium]|nr:PP2C family protein-serine/threonine phosphatase [Lacipirellulaceae bacterium]